MNNIADKPQGVVDAIRAVAQSIGHRPSRREFLSHSGMTARQVTNHFESWNQAVKAAGFEPDIKNQRIDDKELLEDWGRVVRKLREIPTFTRYNREGTYSSEVFQSRFGAWSTMPDLFCQFVREKPEWADVVALLPVAQQPVQTISTSTTTEVNGTAKRERHPTARHTKLDSRPTYGNPIDFRGLRHEPVNEQGVVFLFGMVAKELGYMVEAVQGAYPDCEAKRQITASNWQRVRIEFEYESRNFRDHGHPEHGCDVIVCWRHNWPDCPACLEVVELSSIIKTLSKIED